MKRLLFILSFWIFPLLGVRGETAVDRCEKCHTVSGWQFANFNHAKTAFPLKGSHQIVRCAQCHIDNVFEKKIEHTCGSCHKDVHAGQLGAFCDKCHDETGWKGTFSIEAHRKTNFPLTGRHALIPCEECHLTQRDKTFSRATMQCYDCHQTTFLSTAAKSVDHTTANFGTECRTCHNPGQWQPARYLAHNTCFPISSGPHAGFRCADCHSSLVGLAATGTCNTGTSTCTGCHTGAHAQAKMDSVHASVLGYQYKDLKCLGCHKAGTTN